MAKHVRSIAGVMALGGLWLLAPSSSASAQMVRWRDIAGIVQPGNLVGSGTGQVGGAQQPFSTLGGGAILDLDTGRIDFRVRGLTFAGGNFVGTTGPFMQVRGVLVCDANGSAGGGNSVRIDLPAAPLSATGAASFEDIVTLDPVCTTEPDLAFLIVNPGGMWIAHGAARVTP